MKTYAKKRIDIIIEAPLLRRVIERLEASQVSGYSVFPVLAGRGHEGSWEANGLVGDSGRMAAVMCIVDASELDGLLEDIFPLIKQQIGIVTIGDVQVIRGDHF